ncbi:ABC transporter permease [Cohnella soli]|uniref:ABC transporter permease n=1 Tax=Cohnella soli TaxID=425005 RepID=A0ABW0I2U3_9BACL
MNVMSVLLLKEWRESLRTAKWIWLPAVFLLLGLIQPITVKFMPDILSSAGSLPEGTIIQIPIPKPGEVLAKTLGQYDTIGMLAICLAFMGTISGEKRSGTAAWILVKPTSPYAYVLAKWMMHSLLVVVSFALGYGGAWYYTLLLIGEPDSVAALSSMLLYIGWLLFGVTSTIAFSAIIRSPAGAAFTAFGFVTALQIVQATLKPKLDWLPSGLNAAAASRLTAGSVTWGTAAFAAAICIAALLLLAVRRSSSSGSSYPS